jgi:hypothetical protein
VFSMGAAWSAEAVCGSGSVGVAAWVVTSALVSLPLRFLGISGNYSDARAARRTTDETREGCRRTREAAADVCVPGRFATLQSDAADCLITGLIT